MRLTVAACGMSCNIAHAARFVVAVMGVEARKNRVLGNEFTG